MGRLVLFCLKLAVVVAVAYWLAQRPGEVSIDWLGYRIETSVGLLLLAVFVLVGGVALSYRLLLFLRRAPSKIGETVDSSRRRRGYRALTHGMVAVAAGEADEASRYAKKADSLLDEPPLTMLLSAQAAQLNGDEKAAKRYFSAMLENEETRFLGLRGLIAQSLRDGDRAAALNYAREAYTMRSETPWVLTSLFDLSERAGDLETAERALKDAEKTRALPAPEAGHKRAVILLEQAIAERRGGNDTAALRAVREAHKIAPGLVPAAALYAELLIASDKARQAAKVLERIWQIEPHPDLARIYALARPADGGVARLKTLQRLTAQNADHEESHLALARAALDAQLWGEARRHLSAAAGPDGLDGSPREAICRMMAELEEAERGDTAAARAWLARAASAPEDPAWVCDSCGAVSEVWSPRCGACETFDSLTWHRPPRVAPAMISARLDGEGEAEALPPPALPPAETLRVP